MARRGKKPAPPAIREIPGDLWLIVTKLRGLAILFRMSNGEVPVNEEELHGISYLIGDIADQIDRVRDVLEYGPN